MSAPSGGQSRVYRSLLQIYPADFRAEYTDQMVQLFSDQLRDEGPGRSWLRALGDIPRSALSEHLRRNRTVAHSMTIAPSPSSRLLGLLGVVGGAMLLVAYVLMLVPSISMGADFFNLRLVLFNIGAIAIAIAVYRHQQSAGRQLALAGSIPVILANAIYLAFILQLVAQPGDLGPGDYQPVDLFLLAGAAMWLSDAWLGLVTLRLGVMNRLSALALIVGSVLAFLGMSNFGLQQAGSISEVIIQGGIIVHGLAWIALGLEVAFRRRPVLPSAS